MARLSDSTIQQIPKLYAELGTYKAVAEQLKISPTTVSKYMKKFKGNIPSAGQTNITKELEQEINDYFAFSLNLSETARKFNISPTTVKRHLTDENLVAAAAQSEDKDNLVVYIEKLFNQPISKWNIIQISKFKNNGMNYKAQLLTLKYWFEVLGNTTEKSNNSIGIIPYQIDNARTYYMNKVRQHKLNEEKLKKQKSNEHIIITHTPGDYFVPPNHEKNLINLDDLRDIND